jgi:23S rRNA pseudouridine2605 synthase
MRNKSSHRGKSTNHSGKPSKPASDKPFSAKSDKPAGDSKPKFFEKFGDKPQPHFSKSSQAPRGGNDWGRDSKPRFGRDETRNSEHGNPKREWSGDSKPRFDKPRFGGDSSERPPRKEWSDSKPRFGGDSSERPPRREWSDSKPRFGGDSSERPPRKEWSDSKPRFGGDSSERPPRKEWSDSKPRFGGDSSERPPRKEWSDSKPRFDKPRFDKPRFGGDSNERPPRKEWSGDSKPRFGGDSSERPPRKEWSDSKSRFGGDSNERPPRKEWSDSKPRFGGDSNEHPPRKEWSDSKPRFGGDSSERPPRKEWSDSKPRFGGDSNERPPRKEWSDSKPRFGGDSNERPPRKEWSGDSKPRFGRDETRNSENRMPKRDTDERRPRIIKSVNDENQNTDVNQEKSALDRGKQWAERYGDTATPKEEQDEQSRFKGKSKHAVPNTPNYNIQSDNRGIPQRALKKVIQEEKEQARELIRLNRYIANAGICSRRDADVLIEAGEIKVNGKVITELGYKVSPTDTVKYGNKVLDRAKLVYVLINKPKDFITTTEDPQERKTVMDLVKELDQYRLYPVGRLDRNTTGLLLLTNDGELADKLAHPSNNMPKIYQVEIDKPLTEEHFQAIKQGVMLEDGEIKADDLGLITPDGMVIGIEIHSGRNRIVRRIFEHLGYEVLKLDRTTYAGLNKKDLPRGRWRFLTEKEVIRLKYLI